MTQRKIALSIEEAADYTGIGRNTLRKLVEWKKLPVLKVGRKVLIKTDMLELFKFNAGNGASPILSRKQGNPVVCKLNGLVQHRGSHEPYHRIGVDTKIFMDFCPPLRCVPVDGFLLVLGIPCLNVPNRNKRVSVQKP